MRKPDISRLYTLFYKQALVIYMLLKNHYTHKKGPRFKLSLLEQIILTLFKLRYNLPDRTLESLFNVDHVTISRCVLRISSSIACLHVKIHESGLYIVDTTTLRIGKDKTPHTYSGYKHHHGLKYQCLINEHKEIVSISHGIESSIHDKKVFETEYNSIFHTLNPQISILADKAYVGLDKYNVKVPARHNELKYKLDTTNASLFNKQLSSKRVQIEHVFARIKTYRILSNAYYYTKKKIDLFIKAICNIYNLSINSI